MICSEIITFQEDKLQSVYVNVVTNTLRIIEL